MIKPILKALLVLFLVVVVAIVGLTLIGLNQLKNNPSMSIDLSRGRAVEIFNKCLWNKEEQACIAYDDAFVVYGKDPYEIVKAKVVNEGAEWSSILSLLRRHKTDVPLGIASVVPKSYRERIPGTEDLVICAKMGLVTYVVYREGGCLKVLAIGHIVKTSLLGADIRLD